MSYDLTRSFLVFSMTSLLLACGGGDDENNNAPSINNNTGTSQLSALNGISTSLINTQTQIDLAPFIIGKSTNTSIHINPSSDPSCPAPLLKDSSLLITSTEPGWCDYRYQVQNEQGAQDEAMMTVIASRESNPLLSTISVTAAVKQEAQSNKIEINLTAQASLSGYQLLQDKVKVEAPDGMALGEVSFNNNTISYQPPSQYGWNYIQYALFNQDTQTTRVGYVFITLSDTVNTPPVISPQVWQYPDKVKPGQTVIIELDKLTDKGLQICDSEPGDESCNSQSWQLVGISALGANVKALAPQQIGNKAFEFSASQGDYDVSYIIGDYDGGFTHGLMRIVVDGNESSAGWRDINLNAYQRYSAPLLGSQAASLPPQVSWGKNTITEIINTKQYQVALWNAAEAAAYCASINLRLPTTDEMIRLNQSTNQSVLTERNKWPINKAYFVKDGEQYGAIRLEADNSHVSEVNENTLHYATCYRDLTVYFTGYPAYFTGDSVEADFTLPIKLQLKRESKGVEGVAISHDSDNIISCDAKTNNAGELSCTYQNQIAGVYPVTFTAKLIDSDQGIEDLELTLNIKVTADLNSVQLYTDKDSYDLVANRPNYLLIGKKDKFGNPVKGMQATINNSDPADIDWSVFEAVQIISMQSPRIDLSEASTAMLRLVPNKMGSADFTLSSTGEGAPALPLTRKLNIKSSFDACGTGVDDTQDYLPNDNCLKVVSDGDAIFGTFFAATPSAAVMLGLNYEVHNPTNSEILSIPDTSINQGNTYAGLQTRDPYYENISGYAVFRQDGGDSEGVNGQAARWCQQLNKQNFLGRSTWQRASLTDLRVLQNRVRNGENHFGWPGYDKNIQEWTKERDYQETHITTFKYIRLKSGMEHYDNQTVGTFTTCVSEPEKPALIGVCGGKINDDDKYNGSESCLKVASDDKGNWISATPSWEVIQTLGYTNAAGDRNQNDGKTYAGWQTENGSHGPRGQFALFDQKNLTGGHGIGGQYDRWCKDLGAMNFAGVKSWDRITEEELRNFNAMYVTNSQNEGLFNNLGWSVGIDYWSSAFDAGRNGYLHMSLRYLNTVNYAQADQRRMAACIARNAAQRR